jgi:hypothetical protein
MVERLALTLVACTFVMAACKRDEPSSQPGDVGGSAVVPPETEGSEVAGSNQPEPIDCSQRPEQFGPVIVSASQYATRHAAKATKFSEVQSTAAQPAEVCGIAAGVELIATLTCDDGSNPHKGDRVAAHASRAGNVGPGGRCASIIDHYPVRCPEGSYDIYIDSYVCADMAAFQ